LISNGAREDWKEVRYGMQGILGRDDHDLGRDLIFVNKCGLHEFDPFGHLKE